MEDIPPEVTNKICKELEDKTEELGKYLRDKQDSNNKAGVMQIYRHQLAIARILVNVHGRTPFLLAKAHGNLAESYFQIEYYEAAVDHLATALKLNIDQCETVKDSKNFQIHALTLLGKCYISLNKVEEALEILKQALKSNEALNGTNDISNAKILLALAKAYSKHKAFDKALEFLTEVWEVYEAKFGLKHEIMIEVYTEMAEVYKQQGDVKNAVEALRRKLNLMKELEISSDSLGEAFEKCGVWLTELVWLPQAIDCFREAEAIFIQNNGVISKKTSKLKRKICRLLIKTEEYEEAIKECKELEEIDLSLYGDASNQFGKDLKAIGTILMIIGQNGEALKYFCRALEVYGRLKNKRMVKEVKEKIEMISKGQKEREVNG